MADVQLNANFENGYNKKKCLIEYTPLMIYHVIFYSTTIFTTEKGNRRHIVLKYYYFLIT